MILALTAAMLFSTAVMTGCDEFSDHENSARGSAPAERGYFGQQLESDIAREVYDQLVERFVVERDDVGTFEITFPQPLLFEVTLPENWDNEIFQRIIDSDPAYSSHTDLISRATISAFSAFKKDHPEAYWAYWFSYTYAYQEEIENMTTYKGRFEGIELTVTETYGNAHGDRNMVSRNADSVAETIRSLAEDDSRYAIVKAIHDYICLNASYDTPASESSDPKYQYAGCAAPLFNGIGTMICEGYSRTFKLLCDKLDVPCLYIEGHVYMPEWKTWALHAWNYVQMEDGNWYAMDVTWDDQQQGIQYNYFLCGKKSEGFVYYFGDDHNPDGNVVEYNTAKGKAFYFTYPEISEYGYSKGE